MDFKTRSTGKDASKRIENAIEKASKKQFGCCGSAFIDDTSAYTGPFYAIQGISDGVLDVSGMTHDIVDAADFTIPNGAIIYGDFRVVQLTGGTCLAYYK